MRAMSYVLPLALAAMLLPAAAPAQQAGRQGSPAAAAPRPMHDTTGRAIYDIVAADRETAWRLNRVTGEVTVCRVDTTRVDGLSAHCASARTEGAAAQQSRLPGGANSMGEAPRP